MIPISQLKVIESLERQIAKEQIPNELSRILTLIEEDPEGVNEILNTFHGEDAARRLFDLLNNPDFAHRNGFSTFFPRIDPDSLYTVFRVLCGVDGESLRDLLLDRFITYSGGFFPRGVSDSILPGFSPKSGNKVLITPVENCLGLAIDLVKKFYGVHFTLWHTSPATRGVINHLFRGMKSVRFAECSPVSFDCALDGFDIVIDMAFTGRITSSRPLQAEINARGYLKPKYETELVIQRHLHEIYGKCQFFVFVTESFLFADGTPKAIRDQLLERNFLSGITYLPKTFFDIRMNLSVLHFTNYDLGAKHKIRLTNLSWEDVRTIKDIQEDSSLISQTERITADDLKAFNVWSSSSVLPAQAEEEKGLFSFSQDIPKVPLGEKVERITSDIFRGPSMEFSKERKFRKSVTIRVVTAQDMENDTVDVNMIEPGEIGLNTPPDRYLLQDKDVVLTCRGANIKVSVLSMKEVVEAIPSSNVAVIRTTQEKLDPYFLYMFLMSPAGMTALRSRQSGTSLVTLSVGDLKTIEVPLPSEQREIAKEYLEANKWFQEETQRLQDLYRDRLSGLYRRMGLEMETP